MSENVSQDTELQKLLLDREIQKLLLARYGLNGPNANGQGESTGVIEVLLSHKSIRKFREEPLPEGTLELIVATAQSAATSSNLQTWSVVAVEEPTHKNAVATVCGDQEFIRRAPLFLVFCADLARLTTVSDQTEFPGEGLDYLEMFVMAAIDASLAGQNASIAAEALGLGICYVGAARNHPQELAGLLALPERVIALFGIAIDWPLEPNTSKIKPRLPQSDVLHRETYKTEDRASFIEAYDTIMREFYTDQDMNVAGNWSQHSAKRVSTPQSLSGRHVLRQILNDRGFGLK